jgi:hypothetical protein
VRGPQSPSFYGGCFYGIHDKMSILPGHLVYDGGPAELTHRQCQRLKEAVVACTKYFGDGVRMHGSLLHPGTSLDAFYAWKPPTGIGEEELKTLIQESFQRGKEITQGGSRF